MESVESPARLSRRALSLGTAGAAALSLAPLQPAHAAGFKKELKKRKVPLEDYVSQPDFEFKGEPHEGLKVYDLEVGSGPVLKKGATAVVHYDCKFRGLMAVSSREARLLGGNRTIAEPFELTVGKVPGEYTRAIRYNTFTGVGMKVYIDKLAGGFFVENVTKNAPAQVAGIERNDKLLKVGDTEVSNLSPKEVGALLLGDEGTTVSVTVVPFNTDEPKTFNLTRAQYKVKSTVQGPPVVEGNGLFSGGSGPKPPVALFLALDGMKVGGKRSVIVPADLGYGEDGLNEIPPDAEYFIMDIELLDMRNA